jgi:uncharacterized protein
MNSPWRAVERKRVRIREGFWQRWRDRVGTVTLLHQYEEMRGQGHFDALTLDQSRHRGREEKDQWFWGGSIFWDSDVGKWLEAASARLEYAPDAELEERVDELIARLARAQRDDGYLNSHILTWRPHHRYKNLRDLHELYCAGHLIEAAVVHFEATGKDTLLAIARRLADHLVATFGSGPDRLPGYCGHPEIELALIRLYRLTGEQRYLDLCRFFVEERGKAPIYFEREAVTRQDARPFRPNQATSPYAYMQAHEPIRRQTKVEGHAVRAMYLLSAVADLAAELADEELHEVCLRLWRDTLDTKLYLTGGIGSAAENEGFTKDFDLPNEKAYAETCASIGLFHFAHRLLQFRLDREYGDIMELALYNNILSGIGLDGKTFFYDNPLASRGNHHRIRWPWWCPCCPANLARLMMSLSGYVFGEREREIALHQYIACEGNFELDGQSFTLRLQTGLPFAGDSMLLCETDRPLRFVLHFRVPAWTDDWKVTVNGVPAIAPVADGYATIDRVWSGGDRVTIDFGMPVRKWSARYEVEADRGRLAVTRGPIAYCFEGADNGDQLDAVQVPKEAEFVPVTQAEILDGTTLLAGDGFREQRSGNGLYSPEPPQLKRQKLLAVPYYTWDNRAPGEMLVWVRSM